MKYITTIFALTLLFTLTACEKKLKTDLQDSVHMKYDTLNLTLRQFGDDVAAKLIIWRRDLPQLSDITISPKKLKLQASINTKLTEPSETPQAFSNSPGNYRKAQATWVFRGVNKNNIKHVQFLYGGKTIIFENSD